MTVRYTPSGRRVIEGEQRERFEAARMLHGACDEFIWHSGTGMHADLLDVTDVWRIARDAVQDLLAVLPDPADIRSES